MKTTSKNVSRISDQTVVTDLAGKVFSGTRRRLPIIIAFFYYIIKFLLSVGAYISRAFLRSKLGERTYGVITVLFVYLFFVSIQLTMDTIPRVIEMIKPELRAFQSSGVGQSEIYDLLTLFVVFSSSDPQAQQDLSAIGTFSFIYVFKESILNYQGFSLGLKIAWWLILVLSFMHFIELFRRRRTGEVVHSFHRGKSVFFSFLVGKKLFNFEIKELHIWMFLEPLLIYLLAITLNQVFGFEALSIALKISAICLFFEEYRVYLENRAMVLDIIDSQIDGRTLAQIQDEYAGKLDRQENEQLQKDEHIKTVLTD